MNVFIKTTTNNPIMNLEQSEDSYINYSSVERKENARIFNETILPELKKLYKHQLLIFFLQINAKHFYFFYVVHDLIWSLLIFLIGLILRLEIIERLSWVEFSE